MHARVNAVHFAAVVIALSSTLVSPAGAAAQAADKLQKPTAVRAAAPVTSPVRKSAPTKSANVKSGIIAALETAADTLTLRESAGKTEVYVLTAKTRYNKNRRVVQLTDFKIGDAVVLHFRKSRTDGALLVSELDDSASWTWLADIRKSTTPAVIKDINDTTLSVTVGPDNAPLDYTISDKTRWEKAGKEVEATAFKAGDQVYIVPRSLPSGAIMARAVADSTSGAAQEKERLAASIHGTILTVDSGAHKLSVKTLSGDTRDLAYTDETEVVLAGKPQPLSALKPALRVAARIRRDSGGEETVWRITIETTRKASAAGKRPTGKATPIAH